MYIFSTVADVREELLYTVSHLLLMPSRGEYDREIWPMEHAGAVFMI